jgi:hypothetical protein
MTNMPINPGRHLVAAVNALLAMTAGEQPSDGSGLDEASGREFQQALADLQASTAGLYTAVAATAATIRWASHETGRSESELLDEVAKNFDR